MGEISIKIPISDRIYPLRIKAEEEEMIRRAAKIINERIKEYQDNYAANDKQDLLSMAVLHFATIVLKLETETSKQNVDVADKVEQLNGMLNDFFSK
ncbi:MAG: cell division protein ZapA [Sphingobacteriaceae bacterium]|nr:cell division protein ZapA [Sphingobacteriaceae bacterium]